MENICEQKYPFSKIPLPYAFNGLEPFIDTRTVMIHYERHYGKYVTELNSYLEMKPKLAEMNLCDLLKTQSENITIRHNAGGVYNHAFYFNGMRAGTGQISVGLGGKLLQCIVRDFGSLENMRTHFFNTASSVFGSGYAWLCAQHNGKLIIVTTANQDTPLAMNLKPLLNIDVWEHAYYLKHQNLRDDYINAFWHIIDWMRVAERLG
jgi:Fe-Mn family superoxide dismutase